MEVLLAGLVGVVLGALVFSVPLFFVDELGDGEFIPRFVRVDSEQEEVVCECVDCQYYIDQVISWQDQWANLEDKRTECAKDYLADDLCDYLKTKGYKCEVDS